MNKSFLKLKKKLDYSKDDHPIFLFEYFVFRYLPLSKMTRLEYFYNQKDKFSTVIQLQNAEIFSDYQKRRNKKLQMRINVT